MKINAYLEFGGQCEAAFKFYEKCLGGKIVMMMNHGDSPIAKDVPAERHQSILHARLEVGDQVLMGSDGPPNFYKEPQGFSVSIVVKESTEAERIFSALAENGT